jgi:putative ABC transport system permease protein
MLKNYFKMALRNLRKQRGYSLINIAGLSVGLACFMLVVLFIQYEFRYEKHHDNASRIYRIIVTQNLGDGVFNSTYSPVPLSETLAGELPEVEAFTRIYFSRGVLSYGENRFTEDGISFVDPGVLKMFSFPLIKGHRDNLEANLSPASL